MNKLLYIAEGEIEKRFIRFLIDKNFIRPGKFAKFNLLQDVLKDTSSILTNKVDKIFCILDMDIATKDFLNNLVKNISKLKTISKSKICLLIQNKNFEDELRYILQCSDLGKYFGLKYNTVSDVKRFLADKVNYDKHISAEILKGYCNRSQNFQQELLSNNIKLTKSEIGTSLDFVK